MPILYQNKISISLKKLASLGVSESYLYKAASQQRNDIIKCWPHHKDGKTIYFHFDGLQPKYQTLIKDKLCDGLEPGEWILNKTQIETFEQKEAETSRLELIIITALDNYAPYLRYYESFTPEQSKRAAQTCAAYMAGIGYMSAKGIKSNSLKFYKELGKVFDKVGVKPKNERRVQEKLQAIHNGTPVHEIVTVPRAGNNNRALYREADAVTLDIIKGWASDLMDGHNYTDALIVRTLEHNCQLHQFETIPKKSTLQKWINTPEMLFLNANERYGSNNRNSRAFNGSVSLEKPLFANDVWEIDGTRINFIPHKTDLQFKANAIGTGKNRKAKAADYKFLYIIAIRDCHSGDIVGEWYGYTESRWAYAAALHSACMNTGALPHTLKMDHFPGWNTKEWGGIEHTLKTRYGVKVQYTSHAQGKAGVERFFGTLQTVFMSRSNLYYGEGIKSSRKSAHRTEEYIKLATREAKQNGFDFEKAIQQTHNVIEAYRQTPLSEYSRKYGKIEKSPAQIFAASDKPTQIALEPIDMVRLFHLRTERMLTDQMFALDVLGEHSEYRLNEKHYKFIKNNTRRTFEIRYDAFDLDNIHVFELETREYIMSLNRWDKPIGYGSGAQMGKVMTARRAIDAIEIARKAERSRMIEEAIEVAPLQLPEIKQESLADMAELTALTPHEPKGNKEEAESDLLLNAMGLEPEKDAWEREAENIKIPGIDE